MSFFQHTYLNIARVAWIESLHSTATGRQRNRHSTRALEPSVNILHVMTSKELAKIKRKQDCWRFDIAMAIYLWLRCAHWRREMSAVSEMGASRSTNPCSSSSYA